MKKIAILATIIVAVISVTSSTGAARERKRMVTDTLATDSLHKEYLENLDKMLNLWYVQQSVDTVEVMDQLDLDSVGIRADYPDSVYIERLSGMNTLINLPFNSVVRNYITTYTQKKRVQVEVMLGLADYYFPLFEEILDLYQLPLELKTLARCHGWGLQGCGSSCTARESATICR